MAKKCLFFMLPLWLPLFEFMSMGWIKNVVDDLLLT